MGNDARLFKIEPNTRDSNRVEEIDFADAGFKEPDHIQEWVANDPQILGEDLLVIAKEFSGFDRTRERPDLIAIDREGDVVVVELKRDDSGSDVHWQAIKYASYLKLATPNQLVEMLASYEKISEAEAESELIKHLDGDDLDELNRNQRVILASHRFAPEVTSAVIWLNDIAVRNNLITCIQLTPHHDPKSDSYFIQSTTILPVAGTGDFEVGLRLDRNDGTVTFRPGPVRKEDDITHFLRQIAQDATSDLETQFVPDRRSRWAGVDSSSGYRYFHLWRSKPPWRNWGMSFQVHLSQSDDVEGFTAEVKFECDKNQQIRANAQDEDWFSEIDLKALETRLHALEDEDWKFDPSGNWLTFQTDHSGRSLDDQEFNDVLTNSLRYLVESVTPFVIEIADGKNEQATVDGS